MPKVILIGPPGAGKSTIGRLVAKRLQLQFCDTDLLIEASEKSTISDLFIGKGEEYFRKVELQTLEQVISCENNCVLALGGGAPISEIAQGLLKNVTAPIVFLKVSLSTVTPRIGFNRTPRPLLLGNAGAQWQSLLELRRPVYESLADAIITVDGLSKEEVVAEVLKVCA